MNTMTWNPDDLLSIKTVAALLGKDLLDTAPRKAFMDDPCAAEPRLPPPVVPGLWSPDQIREVMAIPGLVKLGVNTRVTHRWKFEPTEMLSNKQMAALHNPPIKETTVDSYRRRTRTRKEQGKETANPYPETAAVVYGHPLVDPIDAKNYLLNRTGSGWHKGVDEGRRYRGGRGGWRKNKVAESVPS